MKEGACRDRVLGQAMRETLWITLGGMVLGLLTALGLPRLMASQLFGITALDPLTYVVVVVALGLAAVVAGFLPAYRESRIDPVITLRHEH